MAKEYIERDKVLSHKWEVRSYDPSDPDPVTEVVSVSSIMRIPAADVVAVARCRECKHYNAGFECLIEGYGIERPADYFCADGERKDGGQDDGI